MIWLMTLLFFGVSSLFFMVGFFLYANSLLFLGRLGYLVRYLGGFVVYFLFSICLVYPLLYALGIDPWREMFKSNILYMIYFMTCYIASALPGMLFFKSNYLNRLRALGYFKERGRGGR